MSCIRTHNGPKDLTSAGVCFKVVVGAILVLSSVFVKGQKVPANETVNIEINQGFMRGAIGYEISIDDQYIVTWAKSNLLKIYSAKSGRLIKTLRDHQGFVLAANFNPVTGNLFSLDMAGNLIEWDSAFTLRNRQLIEKYKTTYQVYVDCLGMGQVGILYFSFDGKKVFYSHRDFDHGVFDESEYEKQKKALYDVDSTRLKNITTMVANKEIIFELDEYFNIYRAFLDMDFAEKYFLYDKFKTYPSPESKILWNAPRLATTRKDWSNTSIKRETNYDHRWDDFSKIQIRGISADSSIVQCFENEPFSYMTYSISKPVMVLRNNDLLTVIDFRNFSIKEKHVFENDANMPTPRIDSSGSLIEFRQPDLSSEKQVSDEYTYYYTKYDNWIWDFSKDSVYKSGNGSFVSYPTLFAKMVNGKAGEPDETTFASSCKKNKEVAKYLDEGMAADINHMGAVTGTPLMEYKEEGKHIQLISPNELISPTTDGSLCLIDYPGKRTIKKFKSRGVTVQTGFIPSTDLVFIQNTDGTISFFNKRQKSGTGPIGTLNATSKGLIFLTNDNYYMIHGKVTDYLFFNIGITNYLFEQFDLKYNRPDKVLQKFECKDTLLIASYKKAYEKRLKKMGFTEDMLKEDFHLPEIKIKNRHDLPEVISSSELVLDVLMNDTKYKIDRLNVFINDVPIYGRSGLNFRNNDSQNISYKTEIALSEGVNKVQVSVLNQAGAESYKETVYITYKPTQSTKPNLYLVTIGTGKYLDNRYDLAYAAKDANDIQLVFEKNPAYEKVFGFNLTNENVTRDQVKALKKELQGSKRDDVVIIAVAGHGVLDKDLNYYLATYDMDFDHPAEKGLAYEELEQLLDGIPALKKVLLLDACHSGEVDKEEVEQLAVSTASSKDVRFRAVGAGLQRKNLGLKTTGELMGELFTDLRRGTGATVVSSASGVEYAMESDKWKNGLFTYCLLHGLKEGAADLNGDGRVLLSELQAYLRTEVAKLSGGAQQPVSRIENMSLDFRVW